MMSSQKGAWVSYLNFLFNPFEYKEASSDPHLSQYMVDHKVFKLAIEDAPALVFTPPGGGKTATRIYITRSCMQSFGANQLFPLPYVLPYHGRNGHPVTLKQHYHWLLEAGAQVLLVGLAYHPECFYDLNPSERSLAAVLLNRLLPGPKNQSPLIRYIKILKENQSSEDLLHLFHWPPSILDSPSVDRVNAFASALETALVAGDVSIANGMDLFDTFLNLITGPLGFRSIYILIDALDAFPETRDPVLSAQLAQPLLEQVETLAERQIYLKAFLPQGSSEFLIDALPNAIPRFQYIDIRWTSDLLAAIASQRIFIGSGRAVESLDAFSPELHAIEHILAENLPFALPREMLVVIESLLEKYVNRVSDPAISKASEVGITAADIGEVFEDYHTNNLINK
jgi:hypothetical protein